MIDRVGSSRLKVLLRAWAVTLAIGLALTVMSVGAMTFQGQCLLGAFGSGVFFFVAALFAPLAEVFISIRELVTGRQLFVWGIPHWLPYRGLVLPTIAAIGAALVIVERGSLVRPSILARTIILSAWLLLGVLVFLNRMGPA